MDCPRIHSGLTRWGNKKDGDNMLEKIHYGIATLCGVLMVGVMLCSDNGMEGCQWAAVIAGLYLISKVLLIARVGKK